MVSRMQSSTLRRGGCVIRTMAASIADFRVECLQGGVELPELPALLAGPQDRFQFRDVGLSLCLGAVAQRALFVLTFTQISYIARTAAGLRAIQADSASIRAVRRSVAVGASSVRRARAAWACSAVSVSTASISSSRVPKWYEMSRVPEIPARCRTRSKVVRPYPLSAST